MSSHSVPSFKLIIRERASLALTPLLQFGVAPGVVTSCDFNGYTASVSVARLLELLLFCFSNSIQLYLLSPWAIISSGGMILVSRE